MNVAVRTETILSLCSGAGQLDRGVHAALGSARTVCYVERELAAALALAARIRDGALDDAPIWSDLLTFDGAEWRGRVRGIVAGIPCQPHSVAGKRAGADDARDLWPHTAELIRAVSPDWFFLENVPGIARYYFARIRPELRDMGFRVAEDFVTAEEVGARHKRERLFVLADRNEQRNDRSRDTRARWGDEHSDGSNGTMADTEVANGRERLAGTRPEGRAATGGTGATVGDARGHRGSPGLAGQDEGEEGFAGITHYPGAEDFPPGPGDHAAWAVIFRERPDLAPAVEPAVRGMADGLGDRMDLSRTARLRLTGNGVVPQQAALAFRILRGLLR